MESLRLLHPLSTVDPPDEPFPVGIGLGSNEGDRLQNLRLARARIMDLPQVIAGPDTPCLSAPVFETEPLGCAPGTSPFLNTVVEIVCREGSSPLELLAALRGIENSLGRPTRHLRNASRTIDLDILYAGQMRSDDDELTLPHPRLAGRGFVLAPLAVIRPALVLPGETRPVSELLHALPSPQKVALHASHW